MQTTIGTPAFLAPEVLFHFGFLDDKVFKFSEEYTVAVDIWSLGEITFRALTGKPVFPNQSLPTYIKGNSSFPSDVLRAHGVSSEGCDLLKRLMAPLPEDRLTAKEALDHKWIESQELHTASSNDEMQRYLFIVPL